MRGMFGLTTLLTVAVVLTVALSSAGASTKFAYTATVADNAGLVVEFEEAKQKRLASVDYRLEGDAIAGTPTAAALFEDLTATVTLGPDERGRVTGSLTLDLPSTPSPVPCVCGALHIEYFNLTLTNLATGHSYRLDPATRDLP